MTRPPLLSFPAVACTALAVACGSTSATPQPGPEFDVLDASIWSGGTVRVSSEAFRAGGDGALLIFGTDTLPTMRLDEVTLAAGVPSFPDSALVVKVSLQGEVHEVGTVAVSGFRFARDFGNNNAGMPTGFSHVMVVDGSPYIVGNNGWNLAIYDVVADAPVLLDPPISNKRVRAPGPTPMPGIWVIMPGANAEHWDLSGYPTQTGEQPEFSYGSVGSTFINVVAQFGSNVWFTSGQHSLQIHTRSGPGAAFNVQEHQAEQVQIAYLSPDGSRATVLVNSVDEGVPVFDAASGAIAYRTSFRSTQGIAFSQDGMALLMLGTRTGSQPDLPRGDSSVVQVINAANGEVLSERVLEKAGQGIAADPSGRWIYVAQPPTGDAALSVLVLNAADLEIVAELEVPGSAPSCTACYGLPISATAEELVVFGSEQLWRFGVPEED